MRDLIALVDMDSTLADTRHRQTGRGTYDPLTFDWVAYAMLSGDDAPMRGTIMLVNALHARGVTIVILTARPEEARGITEGWLDRHGVAYDTLILPPLMLVGIQEVAAWKLRAAQPWIERSPEFDVLLIDDNEEIGNAFEEVGIPVVRVQPPLLEPV